MEIVAPITTASRQALAALHPEPLRAAEIASSSDPRYRRFVTAHPQAVVFHYPEWLQVLEREYRGRSLILASEDGSGELAGVLPLFYTRGMPAGLAAFGGPMGGRRLSSLPRTPVAGPLALHSSATAVLLQAAVDRASAEPGTRLEIKTVHPLQSASPLTVWPWRVFYTLELPPRPAEIRFGNSNKHSQIKRGVDKAIRQGLRPAPAESEADLAAWYAVYARTMQRNQVMMRSWRLFKAIWDVLRPRDLMRLWLAKRNGKVVAGVLVVGAREGAGTAFFAFGGWIEEPEYAHANDLLHWEAIHEACRLGYRSYDFGEVPEGDAGLAQFKGKWNTRASRLERHYFPQPPPPVAAEPSRPGFRGLAKAAWERMPNLAARRLSDWLYGYL